MARVFLIILLLSLTPALAQSLGGYAESAAQQDPTSILKEEMSSIRNSSAQLQGRIRTAMEKLEEVARVTTEDQKALQVDTLFITLRNEITTVLDQLDSNSAYADALNRAREGTIVLKRWYERQPESYPNRDASIQQLERAVQEYGVLDERLEESRNLAQEKLTTVVRQHRIIIQQMKIGKVLEALDSARAVVEGLNDITRAIAVVEERTNESLTSVSPISN
ncbi:MAG: hypothetical protein R3310_07090 [Candidatus Competibacteraceae bacterium]|nr:hypothetical protein [Candidatus Competibacteraceae bacterium]